MAGQDAAWDGLALEALNRDAEAEKFYSGAIRAGDKQAPTDYEKFHRKQAVAEIASPEIRFEARDLPATAQRRCGGKRLIETMIAGAEVLDFDGDGWPDIYLCNGAGAPNAFLRNNRDDRYLQHAGWGFWSAATRCPLNPPEDRFLAPSYK